MYDNLKLTNKDLTFDAVGKLVLVSGSDAIAQTISSELNTIKGELFYALTYGLDKQALIAVKKRPNYLSAIQGIINDALLDDKRILSCVIASINPDSNNFVINLSITLSDQTIINLKYTV